MPGIYHLVYMPGIHPWVHLRYYTTLLGAYTASAQCRGVPWRGPGL